MTDVIWTTVTAFIGIAALAGGVENWFLKKTTLYERIMLIVAGLMLVYPIPLYDAIGIGLIVLVIVSQKLRRDVKRVQMTIRGVLPCHPCFRVS